MRISLLLLFCFVIGHVWAQDIVIKTAEGTPINGQTMQIPADINVNYNSGNLELLITNTGSINLDLQISKEYIDIVEGTTNDFCWAGGCLPPFTMVGDPVTVNAGATYDGGSVHYHCQGIEGTSIIKYRIFVEGGAEEFFIVEFTASTISVAEDVLIRKNIYPNPAQNNFTIAVEKRNMQIKIYNVLGELIRDFNAGESSVQVDCSLWNNGVYFVRSFDDNELVNTQKLVVAH
jgi:hypothetical protein